MRVAGHLRNALRDLQFRSFDVGHRGFEIDCTLRKPALHLSRKKMSTVARIITAIKSTTQTIAQVFSSRKRFMYVYLSHGPASRQNIAGPAVLRLLLLKRLLHPIVPVPR
jgi:hypothetical protein